MASGTGELDEGGGARAMSDTAGGAQEWEPATQRLAVLLAAAMFVLVVDTSLMNVSIAKVVEDLGNRFRMMRRTDPVASESAEMALA